MYFKTTFALISHKRMCGVYTAFETEGAIIDELSFVILNQYDHKIKRVLMAWQPLRCRIRMISLCYGRVFTLS